MLGIEPDETVKYEVFVTKKCDGNLSDFKELKLAADHYDSMIKQLILLLKHLKSLNKTHYDIKPGNLLFVKMKKKSKLTKTTTSLFDIHLKLADFGICNKSGGTPGWSLPDSTYDRVPGESDLFSVGLVILYLLCEDDELFYSIRETFTGPVVSTTDYAKLTKEFCRLPEINLISQMVGPVKKPSIDWCEQQWESIKIDLITRQRLLDIGVTQRIPTR